MVPACGSTATTAKGPCRKDADCQNDEWCSSGACLPLQNDGGLGSDAPALPTCTGCSASPSAGKNCGCSFDCDVGELCIDEVSFGNPGGSCTRGCSAEDPCPEGTLCTTLATGGTACELPCTVAADCPKGSICTLAKPSGFVCAEFCQSDQDCPLVGVCDRYTGVCSKTPAWSGPGDVGDPCQTPVDCRSGVCFPPSATFPDGYCSAYCSVALQGCPDGSVCSLAGDGGKDLGACFHTCNDKSECRPGYACVQASTGAHVCGPGGG
ncbi:MAG: hypothetical protein U0263_06615 [Polyangiaceae bacterium]